MTVSKRTRFEVLKRDQHTCRYCHATDQPLTIDHVTPVALGGTDNPDNLVACCRDCNAGKAAATPDAELVAHVSDDAVRWAAAMALAAQQAQASRDDQEQQLRYFKEHIWDRWLDGKGRPRWLPDDWKDAIRGRLEAGLTMDDLEHAAEATFTTLWVDNRFRYFMGVCRTMNSQRIQAARDLITNGQV